MYRTNEGDRFQYTASGNVADGALLKIGDTYAVALNSGVTGTNLSLAVEGRFDNLVKKAAANTDYALGGRVYAIATGGVNKLTGLAAAGTLIGFAPVAAVTGDATGSVVLGKGVNAPTVLETQS